MSNKKEQKSKSKKGASQKVNAESDIKKRLLMWISAIVILTYIVYAPSLKNGFTNWDDNVYVPENPLIKSLSADNIQKIFNPENHVSLNYHPITILSLAIDYSISEYNPKVFHFTNLLFHIFNSVLVFVFIYLLSNKNIVVSGITALLFGIHPMHVESVAWISERKDVLYVFFFLGALISYLYYLKAPDSQRKFLYVLVLTLFVFSVLSKAMGIIFPLVLFLIDYYTKREFTKNVILEKIPLLLISLAFGLLAVKIQSNGAIAHFAIFTVWQRICFASYGILAYIYKLFVPINLTCFYAYPTLENGHMPIVFHLSPFIVFALFGLVVYLFNKNKVFVFGFMFYVIALVMVLQFISVGKAIIAERYTYLSYIGLFFPLAHGYSWLQENTNEKFSIYKIPSTIILVSLIVFFAYSTFQRSKVWENSDKLWTDAIKKNPYNETAYTNRGSYLINKKAYDVDKKNASEMEFERALSDFNVSIGMNPTSAKVFTNRANIYGTKNQFDLSLQDYSKAISLDSTDAEVYANRGVTYSIMGNYEKAIADYNKALSMRKDFTTVLQNRAYAYVSSGKYKEGIDELNKLIKQDPYKIDYYIYRGVAYFNIGDLNAAVIDNSMAIKIDPNNGRAYYNRSATYKNMGKLNLALEDAIKAKNLGYPVEDVYLKALGAK